VVVVVPVSALTEKGVVWLICRLDVNTQVKADDGEFRLACERSDDGQSRVVGVINISGHAGGLIAASHELSQTGPIASKPLGLSMSLTVVLPS